MHPTERNKRGTSENKIREICDTLRKEALTPAHEEAKRVVERAGREASEIIDAAKREAKSLVGQAEKEIEEQRNIFRSSIHLACKQSLSAFKQEIEDRLFSPVLGEWIRSGLDGSEVLARLLNAIVASIEKEGIEGELTALIPSFVSKEEVNKALTKEALHRLDKRSVQVADFAGGVRVRIASQNVTIDVTDEAIKEMVATFIGDDFRATLFATP